MKKSIALIFALIMLAACGHTHAEVETTPSKSEETTTVETTTTSAATTAAHEKIPPETTVTESFFSLDRLAEYSDMPLIIAEIHDYDKNGVDECFAVYGTNTEEWKLYVICELLFISEEKGVIFLTGKISGYPREVIEIDDYKFFVWENSAGGSGSNTTIYGVKNGNPLEVNVSRNIMMFNIEDGVITGLTHDFSKEFHDYIVNYFDFDETSMEFIMRDYGSHSVFD